MILICSNFSWIEIKTFFDDEMTFEWSSVLSIILGDCSILIDELRLMFCMTMNSLSLSCELLYVEDESVSLLESLYGLMMSASLFNSYICFCIWTSFCSWICHFVSALASFFSFESLILFSLSISWVIVRKKTTMMRRTEQMNHLSSVWISSWSSARSIAGFWTYILKFY